jgi:hypothetical protein
MLYVANLKKLTRTGRLQAQGDALAYFPIFLGSGRQKTEVLLGSVKNVTVSAYETPSDLERLFRQSRTTGLHPRDMFIFYRDERAVRLPGIEPPDKGMDGVFIGPGDRVTGRAEFGAFVRGLVTGMERGAEVAPAPAVAAVDVPKALVKRTAAHDQPPVVRPQVRASKAPVKTRVPTASPADVEGPPSVTLFLVSCAGLPGSTQEIVNAMRGVRAVVVALEARAGSTQTITTATMSVPHFKAVTPAGEAAARQLVAGGRLEYAEQTDCGRGAMRVLLDAVEKTGGKLTPGQFGEMANTLATFNGAQRLRLLHGLSDLYAVLEGEASKEGWDEALREKIRNLREEAKKLLAARVNPPEVRVVANSAGQLDRSWTEMLNGLDRNVLRLAAGPQVDQAQIGANFTEQMAVIEDGQKNPRKCLAEVGRALASGRDPLGRLMIACGRACAVHGVAPRLAAVEVSDGIRARRLSGQLWRASRDAELSKLLVEEELVGEAERESTVWATYAAVLGEVNLQGAPGEVISVVSYLCRRCPSDACSALPEAARKALRRVLDAEEAARVDGRGER